MMVLTLWTLLLLLLSGFYPEVVGAAASSLFDKLTPEELYDKAVALRYRDDATQHNLQRALALFLAAADIRINGSSVVTQIRQLHGLRKIIVRTEEKGDMQEITGFPGVTVPTKGAHLGAIREVAKALQDGIGVDPHQQLSLELFRYASERGEPEAKSYMGLRHTFGLQEHDSVNAVAITKVGEMDDQQALLHYYSAAMDGDDFARMALGYRHLHGLGVPKSCWTAASYYQLVAESIINKSSIPGSALPLIEDIRLSVHNKQGGRHWATKLQYLQYFADYGDKDALSSMGYVLSAGIGVKRDPVQAFKYVQKAAEAGYSNAMAQLGHMYANGLGTEKDMDAARMWFERSIEDGSPSGLFGLGYMHLTGQGVQQNYEKAFTYFNDASRQEPREPWSMETSAYLGIIESYFYLGVMHLKGWGVKRKNVEQALVYFLLASNPLLGSSPLQPHTHLRPMYNAAMLQLAGRGTTRSCKPAVMLLKQIAERGMVAASLQKGHEHFFKGHFTRALLQYLQAAELGMEMAQSNAAWMMQRGYGHAGDNMAKVAFMLYMRSAEQGNTKSLVALGDAYFYGAGPDQDWLRAGAIYYDAYQQRSAEAMFNLGFMHEFGAGVPKDLQLARQFYRMANHTDPNAYLAAVIASCWLTLHEWWEAVRPMLPSKFDHIWDRIFVLKAPNTSPIGVSMDMLAGLLPSQLALHWELVSRMFANLPVVVSVEALTENMKESTETSLLLGLVITLIFVLGLRRRRNPQANVVLPDDPLMPMDGEPHAFGQEGMEPMGIPGHHDPAPGDGAPAGDEHAAPDASAAAGTSVANGDNANTAAGESGSSQSTTSWRGGTAGNAAANARSEIEPQSEGGGGDSTQTDR